MDEYFTPNIYQPRYLLPSNMIYGTISPTDPQLSGTLNTSRIQRPNTPDTIHPTGYERVSNAVEFQITTLQDHIKSMFATDEDVKRIIKEIVDKEVKEAVERYKIESKKRKLELNESINKKIKYE